MVRPVRVPMSDEDVLALKAGDVVTISGIIVTGRDRIHQYLFDRRASNKDIPFDLSGKILYHCGPVVKKLDGEYRVIAAGPTTSMRVEMFEALILREYRIRGVMGKGGMGERTMQALKENCCVYFHTIGGAAVYLADRIEKTLGVWKADEFGPTEAMWLFEVKNFPAIVTMDSYGNNIHRDIENMSLNKFAELIGK